MVNAADFTLFMCELLNFCLHIHHHLWYAKVAKRKKKKVRSKPPWKSRYIWGHTKVNFYPIFRFTRGKKVVRNFVTKAMPHLSKNERRSFPSTCFTFIFPKKSWIFGQKMKISNNVLPRKIAFLNLYPQNFTIFCCSVHSLLRPLGLDQSVKIQ